MTDITNNPIVLAFISDLDENIVFKEKHHGLAFGVPYGDLVIDFINPATDVVCQVQFEMCEHYERLDRIFYIIDSNKDKIHEELEMENLSDLYDFILMDDVDTTTSVSDLWADTKGGSTMTI